MLILVQNLCLHWFSTGIPCSGSNYHVFLTFRAGVLANRLGNRRFLGATRVCVGLAGHFVAFGYIAMGFRHFLQRALVFVGLRGDFRDAKSVIQASGA